MLSNSSCLGEDRQVRGSLPQSICPGVLVKSQPERGCRRQVLAVARQMLNGLTFSNHSFLLTDQSHSWYTSTTVTALHRVSFFSTAGNCSSLTALFHVTIHSTCHLSLSVSLCHTRLFSTTLLAWLSLSPKLSSICIPLLTGLPMPFSSTHVLSYFQPMRSYFLSLIPCALTSSLSSLPMCFYHFSHCSVCSTCFT